LGGSENAIRIRRQDLPVLIIRLRGWTMRVKGRKDETELVGVVTHGVEEPESPAVWDEILGNARNLMRVL